MEQLGTLISEGYGRGAIRRDPVRFAGLCSFIADDYQARALLDHAGRKVYLWGRRTGKTATASIEALWCATTNSNVTVLIISPSLNQSQEMLYELKKWWGNYINQYNMPITTVKKESASELWFANGSRIMCRPATTDSLRGYGADLVIIDEAARVEDAVLESVVTPMLATTGGRIILISTPWILHNAFYRACMNTALWNLTGPIRTDDCSRVSFEFLEQEREWMPEMFYRQEYYAEWTEQLNQVFPSNAVNAVIGDTNIEHTVPAAVVGADLAKTTDFTVMISINKADGCITDLYELQKTPYPEVVQKIITFSINTHANETLIDQTGVGEVVLDYFEREKYRTSQAGIYIHGYTITAQSKIELINNLKLFIERKKITIPDPNKNPLARKLITQLLAYAYEETPGGRTLRMSAPSGQHDDYVIALALACWCLRGHAPLGIIEGADWL